MCNLPRGQRHPVLHGRSPADSATWPVASFPGRFRWREDGLGTTVDACAPPPSYTTHSSRMRRNYRHSNTGKYTRVSRNYRNVGNFGACANSVYQAFPPTHGPTETWANRRGLGAACAQVLRVAVTKCSVAFVSAISSKEMAGGEERRTMIGHVQSEGSTDACGGRRIPRGSLTSLKSRKWWREMPELW